MTNPFNRETFQRDMKPLLSMAHLSLEYENIESTITKVCAEMSERLGSATYEQIIALAAADTEGVNATAADALDFLQRAILHFTMYHHIIYTIANISNDGVTVTKSDNKTTIYKYQQDQLEEHLLQDAWFWLNALIKVLNANLTVFTCWAGSDERETLAALPVTLDDFERYVGVSDPAFLLFAGWIVREVVRECVYSRQSETAPLTELERQAVCYDVLARACRRLAYHALPSPIRIDINNEMGKNHAAQADTTIRESIAGIFAAKALTYWQGVDAEQQRSASEQAADYPGARRLTENDKFAC